MKDLAYSAFEKLDLRKNLVTIRTYGLVRSSETEEIMNAIIGKVVDWSKTNCRDFYKAVLEHYSEPYCLEWLLAVSGYGEEYENEIIIDLHGNELKRNLASRRRRLYRYLNHMASNEKSMNTQEDGKLGEIAEQMEEGYTNGGLLKLLVEAVGYDDLFALGLRELIPEAELKRIEEGEIETSETNVSLLSKNNATLVPLPIYAFNRSPVEFFVSRDDVIQKIDQKFSDKEQRRMVILAGMGGVGKTQIALRYISQSKSNYDVSIWLDATDINTLEESVSGFLKTYDTFVPFAAENEKDTNVPLVPTDLRFKRFLAQFPGKRILIVYDNADYLDENDEAEKTMKQVLQEYLPDGIIHILITTRCNVELNGSTLIKIGVFPRNVAIDYLAERSGKGLTPETKPFAGELADRLGYLPLALCYAAAYIEKHLSSYEEYLKLWDKTGMELFDSKNYSEQTVRHAFMITLDKLIDKDDKMGGSELVLLALTASHGKEYFPIESFFNTAELLLDVDLDAITPEDLEDMYGTESEKALLLPLRRNDVIRRLVDYSLIEADGERIYMHPILKELISEMHHPYSVPASGQTTMYYKELSEMYKRAGDKKLENKYGALAVKKLLEELKMIKKCYPIGSENEEHKKVVRDEYNWYLEYFKRIILAYSDEEDLKVMHEMERMMKD